MKNKGYIVAENPANGHVEKCKYPSLGVFVFGPLYFAFHGLWLAALVYLLAVVFTGGAVWLLAWLFADAVIAKAFAQIGWKVTRCVEVDEETDGWGWAGVVLWGNAVVATAWAAMWATTKLMGM